MDVVVIDRWMIAEETGEWNSLVDIAIYFIYLHDIAQAARHLHVMKNAYVF